MNRMDQHLHVYLCECSVCACVYVAKGGAGYYIIKCVNFFALLGTYGPEHVHYTVFVNVCVSMCTFCLALLSVCSVVCVCLQLLGSAELHIHREPLAR